MVEVVSIQFRNRGKMYYFDPAGQRLHEGDLVVLETSKGLELGSVLKGNYEVPDERVASPLRAVVRLADEEDRRADERRRRREREAFAICRQKIADHGLDMKLVDVECAFEGNKIIFFFSSDGRVDFRALVKDLAGVFHTRIELRQIGVRDEARMLGGVGICGRPFCCGTFMDEFKPVSTKMAKVQNLSLNPAKISGCCGRLMCCLRYEQPSYEELVKSVPKVGAFVETPDGYGSVMQVNILRQTVRVKLDDTADDVVRQYDTDSTAVVPGGRPRDGSAPPHVLVPKLKPIEPPEIPENDPWEIPERLITTQIERERRSEVHRDRPTRAKPETHDHGREEDAARSGYTAKRRQTGAHKQARPAQDFASPKNARFNKGQQYQKKVYATQSSPAPEEKVQRARNQRNYKNRRQPQNNRARSGEED